MHDKMAISAYIIEKSRKGHILKYQSELRILSVDEIFEILFDIYQH